MSIARATLYLEAGISSDLSEQDRCFTEENASAHVLSNTNNIHLPSPSDPQVQGLPENKGSLNWIAEEDDGSELRQSVLCGCDKRSGTG